MSYRIAIAVILLTGVSSSWGFSQDYYDPPPEPTPVPSDCPSFAPCDAEVDQFVRIHLARTRYSVDGTGLAVAVIDTGVNPQHLSFAGRIIPGRNVTTEGSESDTTDWQGHGSNVAGIIVGAELDAQGGLPLGIAPQALVVPLKVFPGRARDTIALDKVSESLQWVIDHHEAIYREKQVQISVVNLSLSLKVNQASIDAATASKAQRRQMQLIKQLRELGIVVTVAAGNHYASFEPTEGMAFPAICPETTSVGAVFDSDLLSQSDGVPLIEYENGATVFSTHPGRLTAFTQRLGAAKGGAFRTDIFAPGFSVTSAGPMPPAGSAENAATTRTIQDGTSQATPVVSGVVLLLQQHYRNLMKQMGQDVTLPPVDLVERCLREGGKPINDVEDDVAAKMDNVKSCGAEDLIRVDAVGALAYMTDQLQQDLQNLQLELLKAEQPEDRAAVVENSSILGHDVDADD